MSRREAGALLVLSLYGPIPLACRHGMEEQPKLVAFQASRFFADGRAARPRVPGTVARGRMHLDELLDTGKIAARPVDLFPFPIDAAALDRGRERYDIDCSPCHDRLGSGDGMVVRRGFPRPPSFLSARLRAAPAGHFVDVMAEGFGRMYPFSDRVSARDRWLIAAYIRALQLSRDAPLSDAPPADRAALERSR
ncbi:MAG TPA: cytochrome c [Elusimicrobiota bacterium]|jgi:mono/diheme cytochrome c family protein|nr:cytochrome c [Elusimicrobiota bacterium]